MAVLGSVRADHLDFHRVHACAPGDVPPGAARDFERIDCVGDDGTAEAKIVLGDRVSHAIARRSNMDCPVAIGYRVFDRVDAQPDRANFGGQPPRQRAFSRSRQTAEDDQHEDSPSGGPRNLDLM